MGKEAKMSRVKISKKNLKQDEIRHFGVVAWEYIEAHQNKILIGLAAVAVLLIGFKLFQINRNSKIREANALFAEATQNFQTGIMAEKADESKKGFTDCAEIAGRIAREYRGTPLAHLALYLQGSAMFFNAASASDYDEPIELFNEYINSASDADDKAVGFVALGYSYENKYFLSEQKDLLTAAVDAYEKAIQMGGDRSSGAQGKLGKARLLELQKKDDQAAILYEAVKSERQPKPIVAGVSEPDFREPQQKFMYEQLKSMKDLFTFSSDANFSLQRVQGQN